MEQIGCKEKVKCKFCSWRFSSLSLQNKLLTDVHQSSSAPQFIKSLGFQ